MKGAFQVAKIFDIPVKIHWSFGLIFVWIFYTMSTNTGRLDVEETLWLTLGVISLFACVLMHEFGHALTARRYGIGTRDIVLLPIGGVAMLNRLPKNPFQEFLVAAAGPAVNFVIAILCLPYFLFITAEKRSDIYQWIIHFFNPDGNFFYQDITALDFFFVGMILMNLMVAIFNLLPAFPMDGGRIFRALLSMRMGRLKATQYASYVGQFLAVVLLVISLLQFNFLAAFVSVFVFFTAMNEYRAIKQEHILGQFEVGSILRACYTPLYESDDFHLAVAKGKEKGEKQFLVFDQWHNIKGSLKEETIKEAIKQKKSGGLAQIMQKGYDALAPTDSLKDAFNQLYRNKRGIMPVIRKGKLLGVLDEETLFDFLDQQTRRRGVPKIKGERR